MNNQVNNGSSSTSNESIQRMVETSTAMHHSNQMVIAQSMVHRPVNTIKAYSVKQEEWKVWCREQGFEDGYTVSDKKLSFFLMEYVSKRGSKYRRNDDDTPVALGRESILAYVKAISDMCNTQKALGWNTNGVARGPLVRTFLDTLEKEKVKHSRLNYEDRGKNTLNDGYSKEELKKIMFPLSHAMLCRSQTTLSMEFADLFSLEVENQGLPECIALVATIAHGKTNQHGKIEYGSSLRHRDVEVCSIGALALYLFSRFHFENEEFPDFEKRENWYKAVVFKGDSPFKAIQYKAQHSTYVDVFKKVGIHTSKVTHANRKIALNMIAQENVSGDQQRMVGRWGTDRMVGCYVSSLPVEAMKSLAGFNGQQHSNYFLPRAVIKPSLTLQRLVFKDIEYWKERFNTGHDIQEDIAGPNFLNLLAHLRIVLLQDSVVLKKKYPQYYLWNCEIFQTELYRNFEVEVLGSLEEEEEAFLSNRRVQLAMPELVSTLQAGFGTITSSLLSMKAVNATEFKKINQSFGDFFALGNAHFNSTANSGASFPTALTEPSPAGQAQRAEPEEIQTFYKMNREIVSVTDVWREYSEGLGGNPSVQYLEERYGTAWRKERKDSRFFSRRNEIYNCHVLTCQ
ncbi:hypothetical protein RO3G_13723 [Rhizopus delemar RA 99-880]|uniref:Ndc10 domain-containing protein n=1 Tax=Rhizopus delemar (strain RA 99-880 / ATCC MYA-4621 / FGSC 9543 / NRRL 43880) TaxID=246409 RepID=I1CKN2_RHIO9|nr:hypothetical protein RO3G_13723 [Rhizopus delemar RA 99-880]|eukprot:EIE89012.1 hypothetical protein RO3G_13723 [Rhizopus delemar RA 99-880]